MTDAICSHQDLTMPDDDPDEPNLSAAEIEAFARDATFANAESSTPEYYPRMTNMSAGIPSTGS